MDVDEHYREALCACLRVAGCASAGVARVEEAIRCLPDSTYDTVILCAEPAAGERVEFLRALGVLRSEAEVVVAAPGPEVGGLRRALRSEDVHVAAKPTSFEGVSVLVEGL